VISSDKMVYNISEASNINRKDSTFQLSQIQKDAAGKVSTFITKSGDTISSNFISDDGIQKAVKENTVTIPIYFFQMSDQNKTIAVDHFVDSKGQIIKRYSDMSTKYNYTLPMMIFMGFGILALMFAFLLKIEDKKKGYGLELPNIQK